MHGYMDLDGLDGLDWLDELDWLVELDDGLVVLDGLDRIDQIDSTTINGNLVQLCSYVTSVNLAIVSTQINNHSD